MTNLAHSRPHGWQSGIHSSGMLPNQPSSVIFSELLALGQNSMLILMIKFINDPDMEIQYGVLYVIIFALLMSANTLCRQQYIFSGYNLSINIRKSLTGILYNKIEKLTIKSLTETDSGKVISIISGDL